MKNLIELHFDGGCRPSNPGNKYGSFEVLLVLKAKQSIYKAERVEFGHGTNNEAEFNALGAGLKWIVAELAKGGFEPGMYDLNLFTDSSIVCNRVRTKNCTGKDEPARRMGDLTKEMLAWIELFKAWTIQWRSRDHNVMRFGH